MKSYSTLKKTLFALFVLLLCMQTIWGQSQIKPSKEVILEKMHFQLEKADLAYRELKFVIAAQYYEDYIKHNEKIQISVLRKLADCYWQMRNYPEAQRVYIRLYGNNKTIASAIEQFRLGELYARIGNYQAAYYWLNMLPNYAGKSSAYNETRIRNMKQDSIGWHIGVLNMNTLYREFCPVVIDSTTLLFSSNRPTKTKKKAFSWDGEGFSSLWQVPISDLKIKDSASPADQNNTTAAQKDKEITKKRLGGVFVGSDNAVNENVENSRMDVIYAQALGSYIGHPVKGTKQLDYNTGAVSLDKDGVIYMSSNYEKPDKDGMTRIRILQGIYSEKDGISKITTLPFGDPASYSAMHPAINQSGTLLIFSSNKPKGKGLFDLYYSKRNGKRNLWSRPILMPGKINTPGNEVFPSLSPDGYLYYSSDAKEGLGGLDIYRIKLEDALAGNGEPEHLSYPINSAGDDFGWTQSPNGKSIYFTSDRGSSEDNIYCAYLGKMNQDSDLETENNTIQLSQKAMPSVSSGTDLAKQANEKPQIAGNIMPKDGLQNSTVTADKKTSLEPTKPANTLPAGQKQIEGFVCDRQTMAPIAGVTIFMLNKQTKNVSVTKTNAKGKYVSLISTDCDWIIVAAKKGNNQDCLTLKAEQRVTSGTTKFAPYDLLLDKYSRNMSWKIPNVYYNFDKWDIRPDAQHILDELVDILRSYPIKVELGVHTDSRGSYSYNDNLSIKRAQSAVNYIVSKGIDTNRIIAKGYGERKLINRCSDGMPCSEMEHQQNRRTEIKVLSGGIDASVDGGFDPDTFKDGQIIKQSQLPHDFFEKCK